MIHYYLYINTAYDTTKEKKNQCQPEIKIPETNEPFFFFPSQSSIHSDVNLLSSHIRRTYIHTFNIHFVLHAYYYICIIHMYYKHTYMHACINLYSK
jgi:hypothetical protein